MEDREFEELKFKFDQHKQLDDKFSQNAGIFDKQLFTFNLGLMTLVFFALQYSLEFALPKVYYVLPLISIICCGTSSTLLMRTYNRNLEILTYQKELIFEFSEEKSKLCDALDKVNNITTRQSFKIFTVGFAITIISIFLAIFTVDFKKKVDISKIEIINCNMSKFFSGVVGTSDKSFGQLTHKADSMQLKGEGTSFAQNSQKIVEMQVKNVASPIQQQLHNPNQQQNNPQTNNK